MKSRNLSRDLGIGAMFVFVFVLATILNLFGILESYQQFVVVLLSAAATYVIVSITMASQSEHQKALLEQQTSNEAQKEKDTKIFGEKLRIYQNFLHCLCEVIKDGEVTKEEAIQLEFQTSYITMHAKSDHIKVIANSVKEIINSLNSDSGNTAEKASQSNSELMKQLFVIVGEFQNDLYGYSPSSEDIQNRTEASKAFSEIMDAVEVQKEESVEEVQDAEVATSLPQNIADFTEELLKKIHYNESFWTLGEKNLAENNIYLNFAMKGREEAVRVMLSYETNGEHFFQIHMDCDDTHESYKHMKWRFGGRQNKWCWWRYLDTSYRSLTSTEAIKSRNWDGLVAALAKQLSALLAYVEKYQKVAKEIYLPAPGEKANVWMYYEYCVAFDYEKSLGDDRFFMDVNIEENGTYQIMFGNRDNDIDKLIARTHAVGFTNATVSDIKENRFIAYNNLPAAEAATRVAEIDVRI